MIALLALYCEFHAKSWRGEREENNVGEEESGGGLGLRGEDEGRRLVYG